VLLVATTARAQSVRITNADLGKRHDVVVPVTGDVLAGLKAREYRAPMNYPERRHVFDVGPSRGASAGPWDFPPPAAAHRLDGSLWTDPPAAYGLRPRYWALHPRAYGGGAAAGSWRRSNERERTRVGRPAGLTPGGRSRAGASWGMGRQTTR
jgi:hypothetical protein